MPGPLSQHAPGATASLLDGGEHLTEPIDEVLATRLRNRLTRLRMRCSIEIAIVEPIAWRTPGSIFHPEIPATTMDKRGLTN